jgi:hypothetical protein
MIAFQDIRNTLLNLEKDHFQRISNSFRAGPNIEACISGGIQFAALDTSESENEKRLPVIGTFGINYSQEDRPVTELFPYIGKLRGPQVEENTGCISAVNSVLGAYNRNTDIWHASTHKNAKGSTQNAFLQSMDADVGEPFIMFMVNRTPFLTRFKWQDQVEADRDGCEALLKKWPNHEYLDAVFEELNNVVDLWIGHSALPGTEYVWPTFNGLLKRHQIKDWLFTPNLSYWTATHVKNHFQKSGHPLYEFFKAERSAVLIP